MIWITVAQGLKIETESENKRKEIEAKSGIYESFYLLLCDIREILLDSNQFHRLNAFKDTKMKIKLFDVRTLPSSKNYAEKVKSKEMTEEERAEAEYQAFMSGEIIKK